MTRISLAAALLMLAAVSSFARECAADAIAGQWYTEGDESIVLVDRDPDTNTWRGRIVWLGEYRHPDDHEDPELRGQIKTDDNNPDDDQRGGPIISLQIMSGFAKDGDKWTGGTIYDPNNGKAYKGNIWLDDAETLKARGFVGISLFGRTTTWRRVPEGEQLSGSAIEHALLEQTLPPREATGGTAR